MPITKHLIRIKLYLNSCIMDFINPLSMDCFTSQQNYLSFVTQVRDLVDHTKSDNFKKKVFNLVRKSTQ